LSWQFEFITQLTWFVLTIWIHYATNLICPGNSVFKCLCLGLCHIEQSCGSRGLLDSWTVSSNQSWIHQQNIYICGS
jgi:hypothetical protein